MKFIIPTRDLIDAYNNLDIKKPYAILEGEVEGRRTSQQNRALHEYCSQLADALNEAGLDMKAVLKPEVDISWTTDSVKEYIWKAFQKQVIGKKSTTQLKKQGDINKVYDHIIRYFAGHPTLKDLPHIPFPSLEEQSKKDGKVEYPYYQGIPKF